MSAINVCITNAAKQQLVSLPRSMTIAELQKLAPKNAALTVCDCTPSGATTLGDLYDAFAQEQQLRLVVSDGGSMGAMACGPCCLYYSPDSNSSSNSNPNTVLGTASSVVSDLGSTATGALDAAGNATNSIVGGILR